MNSNNIMTPTEFAEVIEEIVWMKDVSYFDAVLIYCEDNELDPEDCKPLISRPLKEKIELDAQELNLLPKTGQLPI
jgi:hypothetical protein